VLTDAQRRGLYAALEDTLGREPASSLMSELAQLDWGDVARRSDIDTLRSEMTGLRAELKGDISELRVELKGDISELRADLVELRADMKGFVARQLIANVPLAFGVAGLVLAAAKLA
jgi:hypothetical protein